jgi:hypothetical protein
MRGLRTRLPAEDLPAYETRRQISSPTRSTGCSRHVPLQQLALRYRSIALGRSAGSVSIGHIEQVEYLIGVHRRQAGVLFIHYR